MKKTIHRVSIQSTVLQEVHHDAEHLRLANEATLAPAIKMFKIFQNIQSEAAINEIVVPLRCIEFFKKASPDKNKVDHFIKQSVPFFTLDSVSKGKAIFNYGDVGDKFYIVLKGRVGVFIPLLKSEKSEVQLSERNKKPRGSLAQHQNDFMDHHQIASSRQLESESVLPHSSRRIEFFDTDHASARYQKVFEYSAGGNFGDLALTTDHVRTASLVALTDDVEIISMTKNDFKKLNERFMQLNNVKIDYFMQHFLGVSKQTVIKFTNFFHELTFNTSTELWKEGDDPQFFFLIKSGKCELYRSLPEKQPMMVHPNKLQLQKTRKIILSTLSNDSFIGGDDIIEHKSGRSYSCRVTEISQVYYMTAEDFNTIRKSYPDIVKCLREKHQLIKKYMSQRQTNLIKYHSEVQMKTESLSTPANLNGERITIKQMKLDKEVDEAYPDNVLRSYFPHMLSNNDIADTNEQLHQNLLKRAEDQFGHIATQKFNMMSEDALNQIKQRIQLKFSAMQGFESKVKPKNTSSYSDILVNSLQKQRDKRETEHSQHQPSFSNGLNKVDSGSSFTSYHNCTITPKPSSQPLLLSRSFNPKHQDRNKLMTAITTKRPISDNQQSFLSKFNFEINRIHSAAPKLFPQQHRKKHSMQYLLTPTPVTIGRLMTSPKSQM